MSYGIKLRVWGDLASFNRPEMKVERVSYDVITPSAARGILEAIYWKPQMRWVIERIHVLQPIRFTHVRRNEISCKISARNATMAMKSGNHTLGIAVEDYRQQRAGMILKDVCYGIEASVEVLGSDPNQPTNAKPAAKHLDQFKRRARKGQYFHHPYLGSREFPANFELVDEFSPGPEELLGEVDLGFMLHDMVFEPDAKGTIVESNRGTRLTAEPRFFRPTMTNGSYVVPPIEQARG